ncbi:hypothetical protein KOW79_011004 [Hemibagrus wyckioides]|uniref:DNA-directed DNA polymerase n=1 Tax=Hemibagrus wyckioides TaxID=337641 RepID=A0A9D3NPF3_9TELE|nr:hypothetical protein KOW79_011004 [Hemibagrus wyckioides]
MVCYSWEAEGFQYASLILKYNLDQRAFVRQPAVFSSSVEYYLNQRAQFKTKLKNPDNSEFDCVYYKMQEGECKVLANSFYGTPPHSCGPLISGHGRQQISVVNSCVATFYRHCCPVVYGDTDSVMALVGYGPGDLPEHEAHDAIAEKFKRAGAQVPEFLDYVHKTLVEDTLKRMYVIGKGNVHQQIVRDPEGSFTEHGYPVYVARVPGSRAVADVTRLFVKDRRVQLEYENSCSIYCHIAKKTYVATWSSVSIKVRGLSAFKSVRSPCDFAITDTFIACVMRGDCVKLESQRISCFSTCPWHQLKTGDVILYLERESLVDDLGRWVELQQASSFLVAYRSCLTRDASVVVRTLYKDLKYCMNHMFSSKEAILRDLLTCKASELIASKMGAGFFPWSTLIKSAKNKHFSPRTLEHLQSSNYSIKSTYVEIVKIWLQKITGLSINPLECEEYHKCNPCEAAFHRYPLNLRANAGCLTAMFGGSMICEAQSGEVKRERGEEQDDKESSSSHEDAAPEPEEVARLESHSVPSSAPSAKLVPHPYQPLNKCFADSRMLIAHYADHELVNSSGKLLVHCIMDYCLPRHMYSRALSVSLEECREHLLCHVGSIRARLKRATTAFNSIMNNCLEHMIPACGTRELQHLKNARETVTRMSGKKLDTCVKVIVEDMSLQPRDVYKHLSSSLGTSLTKAMDEVMVFLGEHKGICITLSLPSVVLADAGMPASDGKLSMVKNQLCERTIVDLAGLLYQTVVMLQTHTPEAFGTSNAMYPDSVLCIMPYSCADVDLMQTWIRVFKAKKWLKPQRVQLGKRKSPAGDNREVTYHCTGCKNFYRDLFVNAVSGHTLIQQIYGQDNKRKIGQCVNESHWIC